jgi:hypothetical protein
MVSDTVDPKATTHPEDEDVPQTMGGALVGDRYELLAMLGAGGMGNVYRARDHELDEVARALPSARHRPQERALRGGARGRLPTRRRRARRVRRALKTVINDAHGSS